MLAANSVLQNRYRIIRHLGQGGMGTVYEAIDERFDHQVAIKETHFTEEALRKQFEREARLLYRLRHPALARVIDHFTENGGQYLVMDYIEGHDLWERLQLGGAFPVEDVLRWGDQLLDALNYLHSQEPPVIHRDIKPQNLKVTSTGQIILLDFGLAKGFAGQVSRVTTSGSIFGYTPNYAPLEQIQGTGTGPYSDLYSLAATLYHLMTGAVPPDVLTRLTATTDGQPDPLRSAHELRAEISQAISGVLWNAMAIGRTQRFSTASEMRAALDRAKQQEAGSSELRETMLPPTIVAPPPAQPADKRETSPIRDAASSSSTNRAGRTGRDAEINQVRQREREMAALLRREAEKTRPQPAPSSSSNFELSNKPYLWLAVGAVALILFVALLYNNSGESNSSDSAITSTESSSSQRTFLTGRVLDQSGSGVAGALVTVTAQASDTRQTVTTNADGTYVFYGLNPNTAYSIEASLPSKGVWLPKQPLRLNSTTTKLDITMRIPR